MKNKIGIILCLLLVFLSGCQKGASAYFEESETVVEYTKEEQDSVPEEVADLHTSAKSESESKQEKEPEAENRTECYVYICGAVVHPGVYQLASGSRIYEAVAMAGGLTEDASADSINQAEEVTDGQMIKILTIEEAQMTVSQTEVKEEGAEGKVNLNTADASQLMTLPGIGASKAESIIAYREEQGGFTSVEELMNIAGIKEGVYSKIKDKITVN